MSYIRGHSFLRQPPQLVLEDAAGLSYFFELYYARMHHKIKSKKTEKPVFNIRVCPWLFTPDWDKEIFDMRVYGKSATTYVFTDFEKSNETIYHWYYEVLSTSIL